MTIIVTLPTNQRKEQFQRRRPHAMVRHRDTRGCALGDLHQLRVVFCFLSSDKTAYHTCVLKMQFWMIIFSQVTECLGRKKVKKFDAV